MVAAAMKKESSHSWWFDSHNKGNSNRSMWLQSTLSELDDKTKTMLKLIEEDADSFAQRAEMYYKKRPELITMVEDFYRTHRSLAERYDQVKSEQHGARLITPWSSSSPLSFAKYRLEKSSSLNINDKAYDSYSEAYGPDESDESEVDDPEEEEEEEEEEETVEDLLQSSGTEEVSRGCEIEELVKLREEVEALKEDNKAQQEQLMQKDEEKREVIRQLSLAMDLLREENVNLRQRLAKNAPKKGNQIENSKSKEGFFGKLFNGFGKSPANLVAV